MSTKTCLFHPPGEKDKLPSFGVLDHYVRHQSKSDQTKIPPSSSAMLPGHTAISVGTCRSRTGDERRHHGRSVHNKLNPRIPAVSSVSSKGTMKHTRRATPLPTTDQRNTMNFPREAVYADSKAQSLGNINFESRSYDRSQSKSPQGAGRSTAARKCNNCGISQTRQWVRGNAQSWLCHSCGQFWRKNGYARPEELWNRPTFRRSSRKRRVTAAMQDHDKKPKPTKGIREASSSYLNGKKMVECGERLAPLGRSSKHTTSDQDVGVIKPNASSISQVVEGRSARPSIANMIHGEPPLPPVSSLLKRNPSARREGQ